MGKERGFIVFVLILLASMFLINTVGVSAYSFNNGVESVVSSMQNSVSPLISAMFGGSWEYLFEKLLFFILLLVLIFAVMSRIPMFEGKIAIIWIIDFAVSLLATRFLTEVEFVQSVLLPYQVFGVALLSFIPFLIYFYFVELGIENQAMRRIAWVLYMVVFVGLWWSRYSIIGKTSWIFFASAVLALIVMLADNTIQGMFVRNAIRRGLNIDRVKQIVKVQKEIEDDMKLLQSAHGDQRRKILKDLAEKEKTVKALSRAPYV